MAKRQEVVAHHHIPAHPHLHAQQQPTHGGAAVPVTAGVSLKRREDMARRGTGTCRRTWAVVGLMIVRTAIPMTEITICPACRIQQPAFSAQRPDRCPSRPSRTDGPAGRIKIGVYRMYPNRTLPRSCPFRTWHSDMCEGHLMVSDECEVVGCQGRRLWWVQNSEH